MFKKLRRRRREPELVHFERAGTTYTLYVRMQQDEEDGAWHLWPATRQDLGDALRALESSSS